LGLWDEGSDGFVTEYRVALWDASETLLRSTFVSSASEPEPSQLAEGRWLFEPIEGVLLNPGEEYTIAYQRPGDADRWRFDSEFTFAPEFNYLGGRELITPDFVFPTAAIGSNRHFGPNLRFEIPEPTTLAIATLSLAALARARRRTDKGVQCHHEGRSC
ncbi:MAG: PEP-CTERM sorting domain-containing protein, partial [Planctomycetota bacterium]